MIDEINAIYTEMTGLPIKEYNTPGFPGSVLVKSESNTPTNIEKYRSIVGKLLYMMTKCAPEIANAVRELSSHLANPNKQHWQAVGRVVGYLHYHGCKGITF